MFVETCAEARWARPRLSSPTNRTAVNVMHMRHLPARMDDSFLDWITDVGTFDRSGRITEGVRAVRQRFVDLTGALLGEHQAVEEGLTAIVECP